MNCLLRQLFHTERGILKYFVEGNQLYRQLTADASGLGSQASAVAGVQDQGQLVQRLPDADDQLQCKLPSHKIFLLYSIHQLELKIRLLSVRDERLNLDDHVEQLRGPIVVVIEWSKFPALDCERSLVEYNREDGAYDVIATRHRVLDAPNAVLCMHSGASIDDYRDSWRICDLEAFQDAPVVFEDIGSGVHGQIRHHTSVPLCSKNSVLMKWAVTDRNDVLLLSYAHMSFVLATFMLWAPCIVLVSTTVVHPSAALVETLWLIVIHDGRSSFVSTPLLKFTATFTSLCNNQWKQFPVMIFSMGACWWHTCPPMPTLQYFFALCQITASHKWCSPLAFHLRRTLLLCLGSGTATGFVLM